MEPNDAAVIIQRAWRRFVNRAPFKWCKERGIAIFVVVGKTSCFKYFHRVIIGLISVLEIFNYSNLFKNAHPHRKAMMMHAERSETAHALLKFISPQDARLMDRATGTRVR